MKINPPLEQAQNSDRFTLDYLNQQIVEFRKLFGSKDFWQGKPSKRDLAVKALSFVYVNLNVSPDENEQAVNSFQSTIEEFTRRESMLLLAGKVNLIE